MSLIFSIFVGRLDNEYIGSPIVVKGRCPRNKQYDMDGAEGLSSGSIVHEVKRVGLLIDRYVDLQLRIGDQLIMYISKSQA